MSAAPPLVAASSRLRKPPGRPRTRPAPSDPPPTLTPRLLDLRRSARYLDLSTRMVESLIAAGILRRVRVPLPHHGEVRKILLDRDDLDTLVETWKEPLR
jgi:hypothetical protein